MPANIRRERALRHALRYRREARHWQRRADTWLDSWLAAVGRAARQERRIATLEAAIDRALTEGAAGCGDWRRALEEVRG